MIILVCSGLNFTSAILSPVLHHSYLPSLPFTSNPFLRYFRGFVDCHKP